MRKPLDAAFLTFIFIVFFSHTSFSQQSLITTGGWNAYVHLPDDYDANPTKKYPTILFIPGLGEVGSDPNKLISNGPGAYLKQGWNGNIGSVKFIVISLQPPGQWPRVWSIKERVDDLKTKYRIGDLYMTGLSMGGWASLWYSYYYPNEIKKVVGVESVVPVEITHGSAYGDMDDFKDTYKAPALAGIKYLLFEQNRDHRKNDMVADAVNFWVPGAAFYKETSFGGGGHCCWNEFYGGGGKQPGVFNISGTNQNLYEWLAATISAANQAPVAHAGDDITITLPTNTVSLSGSGNDADGNIVSYQWKKISGPSGFQITAANSATTNVTNLTEGTYQFELTVTDDKGAVGKDSVTVIVKAAANQAPVAHAGDDITITLPTNTVSLSGSGNDADGNIVSYQWKKISGPSGFQITAANSATTNVTNLTEGSYQFELTVTDDKGAVGKDTVTVIVKAAANQAPVAHAGDDITITLPTNTVSLSGSGNDADGNIVSYQWKKISGPSGFQITAANSATTNVTNLTEGSYQFELTVTDDKGAVGKDTVTVIVKAAANQAPVAHAGDDITITLPTNTVSLSGSGNDADGNIVSYQWKKISGPSGFQITAANSATTNVTNLTEGSYQFELTVTDDKGAVGKDTVTVIVKAAANQAPVAHAGDDITITLPTNTVSLSGSGNDADGNIVSYQWKKISGPSGFQITAANSATTNVTNLMEGTYQFELTVTDDKGAVGKDTVTVIVKAAANQAPVAHAGDDITITLPTNTVSLSGSGNDADGNIVSFEWSKVSGPASFDIQNTSSAITEVNNLVEGTYEFQLVVTDDRGATAIDTVKVKVNAAIAPPVANAGADQTVLLPQNSTLLTGSGSDPVGISSFKWNQLSGPSLATIADDKDPVTEISDLKAGEYVFRLEVLNISGLSASADVKVLVKSGTGDDCGCDVVLPKNPDGTIYFTNGDKGINVKPGDKVCIKADRYSHIYLRGIVGTAEKPVTIINCGGQVVVGESNTWNISIANCSYFRFTGTGDPNIKYGFKVNWPGGFTGVGIGVGTGCTDYEIDHYEAQNVDNGFICKVNPADCEPDTWGQNWTIRNVSLHDNYIHNTTGEAFYIGYHAATADVKDCSTGQTITVEPVLAVGVKIYNNIVDSAGWDGIQLVGATNALVYNNKVTNFGTANRAGQNYGIIFGGKNSGKVYDNFVANGSGSGMAVTGFNNNTIYNNLIANVGTAGITVDDRPMPDNKYKNLQVYIFNNTVVNGETGIRILDTYSSMTTGNKIYNNLVVAPRDGNNSFIATTKGIDVDTANNQYYLNLSDAGFVNPGALDFSLLATSNAINAGRDLSQFGVIDDINGLSRPQGTAYDVGAYEYNENTPPPNQKPVAAAGTDQTIKLPVNSVTISGSGTDRDGQVVSYQWKKVAGPAAYNIVNPDAANTEINSLVEGIYIFELTVTDDKGDVGKDSVKITVTKDNILPAADAGKDQTITLPANSVSLAGSGSDADGRIVSYLWTKVSGPTSYTIVSSSSAATEVNGLTAGVYTFQLKVTDDQGATAIDEMTVTVNAAANKAPIANAGPDRIITLPANSATLSGSGSDDDGRIVSYLWTKVSGPTSFNIVNAGSPVTDVTGLTEGVYEFQLKVTDDKGATATDVMKVTVNPAPNKAPVANAGPDRVITLPVNTASLAGSGSDADGRIVSYLWTKISGPANYSIVNTGSPVTDVTGLTTGIYEFQLTVKDDKGATASDVMRVTVNAPANKAPVANAGPDRVITLPVNTTTLSGSGSDADGRIVSYQWTKTSGPAAYSIVNATSPVTDVNGLVSGVYEFQLKVTDDKGAIATSQMKVTVNVAPNKIPVANAGNDISITLPVNQVVLNGSGHDEDGSVVKYLWVQVSGPSVSTIVSPGTASTEVNTFVAGTYKFELIVTDDKGAIGRDTMQLTVAVPRESLHAVQSISIYPNPTYGISTLEINGTKIEERLEMVITDGAGRVVQRKEINTGGLAIYKVQVDLTRYPEGAYVVSLLVNGQIRASRKIIKLN